MVSETQLPLYSSCPICGFQDAHVPGWCQWFSCHIHLQSRQEKAKAKKPHPIPIRTLRFFLPVSHWVKLRPMVSLAAGNDRGCDLLAGKECPS